jgi:UDP-N-acetylmuramoyl-tripeptide--D-alanyl-D-alanine ligase
MQAKLHLGDRTEEVLVKGVLGAHALMPLVAAAAVGLAVGRSATDILTGLDLYQPPKGRMRLIAGLKGSLIIDDTYNSSPAAVSAALDTLKSMKHGRSKMRRIAVLGDMLELGRLSVEEHRKIGAQVAKCADSLVTVGFRARDIAESALSNGMADQNILQYEDSLKVGQELQNLIDEHDVVLVKGSQSMRMERIVEDCMLEPEKAKDLLVRQDAQWKRK